MKKDLMPDYKHKPSSREYLLALTNFTNYCKLINADGKAYKNLINWIITNGPELRDSNEKFPDLKEIELLTNTPYNNIAKYLRDIYNDICSLNNDDPKAFAEGSQNI
jgi:ribonucleotide reductase beta subunit family protein with ferritin-like domain